MLVYNLILFFAVIMGCLFWCYQLIISEKRRKTFLQRLFPEPLPPDRTSAASADYPENPVWVHALSVGEVLSSVPLVKKLAEKIGRQSVVFSASTKTGFDIACEKLGNDTNTVFYFPYDFLFSINRVLKTMRPRMVVIVETDIWPNFLFKMQKNNIPVLLVNARLSDRSFSGYRRIGAFARTVFSRFSHVCAQTGKDAHRFHQLGLEYMNISITGNIKFDQPVDAQPAKKLDRLIQFVHSHDYSKIIVAGSTHEGEEPVLVRAFLEIRHRLKNVLLILVPRDPNRCDIVSQICVGFKLDTQRLSKLEALSDLPPFDVIIVDSIGVLRFIYRISDIAFIGGSLSADRGHNPLEAAAFSKPILFGPNMQDFQSIADQLIASGGAVRVHNADELVANAAILLENDAKAKDVGKAAYTVFSDNKGAVERTLRIMDRFI